MSAGTSIHIPLSGNDPGHTVNYSVTASDYSKLTPVMTPQTNKSLELKVLINGVSQTMDFRLLDNLAPLTAAHIEALVNSGFYNGLSIYRNGKNSSGNPFVIQGGNDPPTGPIKTDQSPIAEEFNPDLQFTSAGLLAMARSSTPSTSSTEFFITEEPARFLDYNYTIFGVQTAGTDVISTIAAMPNQNSTQDPSGLGYLATPLTITSASIFTDTQNGVLQLRAPAGVTGTVTVTATASDGTNTPVTQSFTVTIESDLASNPASPFDSVTPAAPTSVAFLPPTGASSQVTNLNNSDSSHALQFQVSGVTSGNAVQVLADGNPIGQATASGATFTVTTDGLTKLTEGPHKFTAIQIATDQTVSVTESGGSAATSQTADVPSLNSSAVQLTVDSVNDAPVLTAASPSLGSTALSTAKTIALSTFINHGTETTSVTDVDTGAVVGGIALTAVTGNGTWAYSTDGSTFTAVGTVSTSSALLLPSSASLRYTPGGTSTETATIAYRAWDTSSGTSGSKVDTTANGGTTAFSTATDTASLSIGTASISGFVYVDTNNDGLRTRSNGDVHLGLAGVPIRLLSKDSGGNWTEVSGKSPVLTGSDGSYSFTGVAPGTYRIQENGPGKFLDGIDSLGTVGGTTKGTASDDLFEVALAAGESGSGYNFGERGLRPGMVTLRLFLASSGSGSQIIAQLDAAPVVDLTSSASGTGRSTTYQAGGSAVAIAASDAIVADADSTMLASMTVTITNRQNGDSEVLAADTSGTSLTSAYTGGVLTITGAANPPDYRTVLATIRYSNTASSPQAGDRTITVVASDGITDSKPAVATVTVESAPPSGYTITANDSLINASEASATSFTFAGAQVGATYSYTVRSSGGGTAVTGSGTVSSATQQVTGINVSSLSDGTLTYSVTLTDTGGHVGAAATGTATLDNTAPTAAITPSGSTVNTSPITFTVTFNEAVTGVDVADLAATGSTTGALTPSNFHAVSATVYTVDVSGMASGENVTLTLAAASSGISDTASNALAANATATVGFDNTAPTAAPTAVVNGTSLVWTINFNEGVTGLDVNDLAANGSLTGPLTLQNFTVNSASLYTVEVVGMTTVQPGEQVTLRSPTAGSFFDLAGNLAAVDAVFGQFDWAL